MNGQILYFHINGFDYNSISELWNNYVSAWSLRRRKPRIQGPVYENPGGNIDNT